MAKADFLTGLILVALGIYMIFEGTRLPGEGGFIEAGGEPGRVPIMVGGAILLLAAALVIRSVGRGGHRLRGAGPVADTQRRGLLRCLGAAVLCSLYAVGLLGAEIAGWKVAYQEATFVFLLVFIVAFEWRFAPELADARCAFFARRAPGLARAAARRLAFLPPGAVPFVWLVALAAIQSALVTWAVTYLFEQQFYVKLP
jgi:hypothetical protein